MTFAEAERIAREAAHALTPCDHDSTRAIEAVAHLLLDAYHRGRTDQRAETRKRLFPGNWAAPERPKRREASDD
jgi:hypothetical protein